MTVVQYYDDVYMVNYRIIMKSTSDEFYDYIEEQTGQKISKEDVNPWNSLFEGLELDRELQAFIFLHEKDENLRGLAHETAHAVTFVFEIRGIPINREMDEAFCWYYDFLVNKFQELSGIKIP